MKSISSFQLMMAAVIAFFAGQKLPAATINNGIITVAVDQGRYAIQAAGQSMPFARGVVSVDGKVDVVAVNDDVFGSGQAINVTEANGSGESFLLFPRLPFALHRSVVVNTGNVATVLNKVPGLKADLELPTPPDRVVALGTGGLHPLAQNVGSYAWMAVADPATRAGVVGGWLTHERGSGVVFANLDNGIGKFDSRLEYGRLRLEPGKIAVSETFIIGWFADVRLGLEAWADAVAAQLKIKLPPMPIVYCTWYDNVHGGSGDARSLAELGAFASKALKPYGLSCLQIDDGWQMGDPKGNGPRKNFSAFNPAGPYPNGMKATAQTVNSNGFTAGLWILPFGGTWNDPFFAAHQDWFVKKLDGSPFDTAWGGTALDMTQDGAREFVKNEIKQAVHDWDYGYLKLDGLSTGAGVQPQYVNDSWKEDNLGDGVFCNPAKPNIEVFRDGLRMIREAAGPQTFILGCCAPQNMRSYAGVFGLVDAMRMGPDNGGNWNAWKGASPDYGSRNYHLNGRIWWSDPDPIYVRESIPLESARCIASWNAISGQMISLSDWLPTLPVERLEIIRRCIPGHGVTARPIDLLNTWPPRQWLVTDERPGHQRRDVLGVFNWSAKEDEITVNIAGLGLPAADEYVAFDFWNQAPIERFKGTLKLKVPGQACRILAVRPATNHPFLISTSRHVSQGILEIKNEVWDEQAATLAGTSAVVAEDRYELRVVPGASKTAWSLIKAELSPEDVAAGVTVSTSEDHGIVRAVIHSPASRDVRWTFHFSAAKDSASVSWPGEKLDVWNGFTRHRFIVDGCEAWVVEPKNPLPGKPWSWCMEFPDAFVDRCAAPQLLARGFYHAHIQVGNTFGCPDAIKHFNAFYDAVRGQGLASKVALIGISRGGLYSYRWASENPGKVSVIYGDAPVCDFKSWPAGKGKGAGSKADWDALIADYHFKSESEALAYPGNPVDTLAPIAKAGIALIHVVGDADDVVPVAENTALIEERYKRLGGEITVIHKPGIGHHPHGLEDPSPVVDFILKHAPGLNP